MVWNDLKGGLVKAWRVRERMGRHCDVLVGRKGGGESELPKLLGEGQGGAKGRGFAGGDDG